MIIFIVLVLVVGLLGFFAFRAMSKESSKSNRERNQLAALKQKMISNLCLVATIIISLFICFVGSVRIMDSTKIGVVKTFGKIDRTISGGFNIVNPFIENVTIYDLKVHVKEASFASYTRDAQPITASIEYQYSLDPTYVMDIAKEYGSYEALETKLCNVVEERAKIVFSKYSAMPLLENRANLSAEVATEVKELEGLFHVMFSSVVVRDIDFSDAFEASVEAKMTAEQDALRAEQEKRTAIVKAEQEKETAIIKAQQEQETTRINAESKIIAAKAESDALAITREALKNMPDNWLSQMWIEKWNGVLPQIITDGSNMMINPTID